jgi:nucleoid-associated protein YgaU
MQLGKKLNLKIEAFKDPEFNGNPEMTYEVVLNPHTFRRSNQTRFLTRQAGGTSGSDSQFDSIRPEVLSFSFIIDGSGIDGEKMEAGWSVEKEVTEFRKLRDYQGTMHSPFNLKIFWGKLLFKGVMEKCDISYTLFDASGEPLRAKIEVSFLEKITDKMRDQKDKPTSPDLTHLRVVKEGDTLPLMTNDIYGDPKYYLEVARANQLNNYRKLKPGQKLFFPPLK